MDANCRKTPTKKKKKKKNKTTERNIGVKMAVNDFRRLCEVNLLIHGTISA